MSITALIRKFRFFNFKGNFLYRWKLYSFASSTSSKKFLNFSINLENKCFYILCSSSFKKVFILFASIVPAANLSSIYSPYFPPPRKDCLRSSAVPMPGMMSLKLLAWPRVILSKWWSSFFWVMMVPLTNNLASGLGSIYIFPFSLNIEQWRVAIPRALSLIWF